MSLIRTKHGYEADLGRGKERIHVSLRTTRVGEAQDRHAALKALIREGQPELVADLKSRKLTIESVARCWRERKGFETLRRDLQWPTLSAAIVDYSIWVEDHRSPRTQAMSAAFLSRAQAFFGGDTPVDLITTESVAWYRKALADRGCGPNTISHYIIRLSTLFNWVQAREIKRGREGKRPARTLYNPVEKSQRLIRPATRVRFLSFDEAVRLLRATPDRFQFGVAAGILAGLRLREMLYLRPPPFDIDLERDVLTVQAKGDWTPKTKTSTRHVPIAPELKEIIERHIPRFASQAWMLPGETPEAPYNPRTWILMFRRCVEDAGLVSGQRDPLGVTYHTLRHTFASWLVMAGVDLFTVSKLLGHASTKEVERTYGHLSPDHLRTAITKLSPQRLLEIPAITTVFSRNGTDARDRHTSGGCIRNTGTDAPERASRATTPSYAADENRSVEAKPPEERPENTGERP